MTNKSYEDEIEEEDGSQAPDNSQGWLISYADMMTLIACFFILMMAFANYEPIGFNIKAEKISKAFRKDKNKSSDTKMKYLTEEIAKHPELKKLSKISLNDSNLVVTLSSSVLFPAGTWKIGPDIKPIIDALVDLIKTSDPLYRVVISGHTDDTNIARSGNFTSSWVLSSARASSIAERFEYFGFEPKNIIVIGRGASSPLMPNRDKKLRIIKKNLFQNNRVEIKIFERKNVKEKIKFGLGIYLDDATR